MNTMQISATYHIVNNALIAAHWIIVGARYRMMTIAYNMLVVDFA